MEWCDLVSLLKKYFDVKEGWPSLLLLYNGAKESVVCFDKRGRKVFEASYIPDRETVFWRSVKENGDSIRMGTWYLPIVTEKEIRKLIESGELWK